MPTTSSSANADDLLALIAALGHDLRSPLHRAVGFARLLHDAAADADSAERRTEQDHARRMLDALRGLETVLDDMVALARIAAGGLELERGVADVASLCRSAAAEVGAELAARAQTLRLELPEAPLPAEVDARRLAGVLSGTLLEASRAAPRDSALTLGCARMGSDSGVAGWIVIDLIDQRVRVAGVPLTTGGSEALRVRLAQALSRLHGGSAIAQELPGSGRRLTLRLPPVAATG